jgi:hypothetical protein
MTTLYGMWGDSSQSWITYQGRVIAHPDRAEMEFLCPGPVVRPLNGVPADEVLMLRDHPQLQAVTWPLRREDFRG